MRRKTDEANNTGLQTKRVGRGEKVRFTYNMPTATDQEIIVYAGHYLKRLGDVSNLQPTSMLIANADRLTEIECHSPNLINTDLSECTKLQRIDLSNCTALGTGIGAQPILNIQNCKYLRYCDCRNTQLTAIYTMQAGGNLEEIYYPQSTQVVQLTNQTYLHTIGLPSTNPCENLADVQITNCNAVKSLSSETIALDFNTFKYVQNLNITNSLIGLNSMQFNGFDKLRNVTLSSLKELDSIGFEDMMPVTTTSTLKNITISDCPLITSLSFNVSSDDYKVAFASNGKLDLGGLQSLKSIECNTSVKGLDTLIVPTSLTELRFTTEHGDGINEIKNIWSASAVHNNDGFEGIDFQDMTIEFIDMLGLNSISNAINFHIAPKTQNPHLNTARDGSVSKPWFHPIGSIDLSNYTGLMIGMLRGVDLNKLDVVINTDRDQVDLTSLFECATLPTAQNIVTKTNNILAKFPKSVIWDYMFKGCDLSFSPNDIRIPNRGLSLKGMYKDSNVTEDVSLPNVIMAVDEMFMNCTGITTYEENWLKTYSKITYTVPTSNGTSGSWDDSGNYTEGTSYNQFLYIPSDGEKAFKIMTTGTGEVRINYFYNASFLSRVVYTPEFDSYPYVVTIPDGCNKVIFVCDKTIGFASEGTMTTSNCYTNTGGALSEIPTSWGGYGLDKNVTSIYVIDTTFLTNTTTFNLVLQDNQAGITDWGDGVTNSEKSHTYAEHGIYTIKTKSWSNGVPSDDLKIALIEVKQIKLIGHNGNSKNYSNSFNGCTNLRKITAYNLAPTDCGGMFQNCSSLTEIIGIDTWDMSNCTNIEYMFKSTGITDTTPIYNMLSTFTGSSADSLFRESKIESIELGRFPSSIKDFRCIAWGCTNLKTIDFTNCVQDTTNWESAFRYVKGVTSIIGLETLNASDGVVLGAMFFGTDLSNIGTIDMSGMTCKIGASPYFPGTKVTTIKMGFDWSNITGDLPNYMFTDFNTLENMEWGRNLKANFTGYTMLDRHNNLTVQSLLNLFNALYDFSEDGGTHTVIIGATNIAKLTREQMLIAIKKHWTIQGAPIQGVFRDTDVSTLTSDDTVTAVAIELTADNYLTRIDEVLGVYTNAVDVYFFDDGSVTTLDNMCYNNNTTTKDRIQNVTFLDGYFENCTSFSKTFYSCTGLVTVTNIPNNITNMYYAFFNNTALTTVSSIPSKCIDFGVAFRGCRALTSVPENGWTGNLMQVFLDCSSLNQQINIVNPNNLENAFSGCSALEIYPTFTGTYTGVIDSLFYNCSKLTNIVLPTTWRPSSAQSTFSGCTQLVTIENLNALDMSSCTSMGNMFFACRKLSEVNLSNFNTGSCENFGGMFQACSSLIKIDVSSFDINNTNGYLGSMFQGCTSLISIIGLDKFNTSKVTSTAHMFLDCPALSELDLSNWDFSNISTITKTFGACTSLTKITLNNITDTSTREAGVGLRGALNTIPQPVEIVMEEFAMTDFSNLFQGVTKIKNDIIFPTNATNVSNCFKDCTGMTHIHSNWNNPYVLTTNYTYVSITDSDFIGVSDVESVYFQSENMSYLRCMGYDSNKNLIGYYDFKEQPSWIDKINTAKTTTATIQINRDDIKYIKFGNIAGKTSITKTYKSKDVLEYTTDCYSGCTGITHCDGVDLGVNEYTTGLDEIPIAWGGYGLSKDVTSIIVVEIPSDNYEMKLCDYPEYNLLSTKTINWGDGTVTIGANIHTYVTAGRYIIKGHVGFGKYMTTSQIRNCLIEVKQLATLSNLLEAKSFEYALSYCTKLTKVTAYDLAPTNCNNMFIKCSSLTEIIGMDTWDMNNCTNVSDMFSDCSSLPNDQFQAVSAWNTPKVTTIKSMFAGTKLLTSIDISNFTSVNVIYTAFTGCSKLEYVKLGGNINDATQAFRYCSSLTRIDNFNVNSSLFAHYLFHGCNKLSNIEWKGVLSYGEAGNSLFMIDGCPLSVDTMVGLFNILAEVTTQQILTLGSTNLAKLTDEQKMIAVNKGWLLKGYNTVRMPASMDISSFTTNNDVTKVYVELTSENATSRIAEIYAKFPNITEIYLFEDGSITEAVDIFTGVDNTIKAQITKVVFMEGYFNNVTLDMREYGILDEVPISWGGFGFSKATTSILELVIPEDNYTLTLNPDMILATIDEGEHSGYDIYNRISWGDGTVTEGEYSHTYTTAGTYTFKGHYYMGAYEPTATLKVCLSKIHQIPRYYKAVMYNHRFLAKDCKNLTEVTINNFVTTPNNNGLIQAFNGCTNLQKVTITADMPLYNLRDTFRNCTSLVEINGIETWDTSTTKEMYGAFYNCSQLPYSVLLQLSNTLNFDSCTNVSEMFYNDTFDDAIPLQQLKVSNMTNFDGLLSGVKVNGDLDLSMWNVHPTNLTSFLNNATINGAVNLSGWDVSSCTSFRRMLHWSNTPSVNLSGWDFSGCTDMDYYTFIGCPASDWNFTGASGIKFNIDINNSVSQNWSVDSLVGLFNALYDFASAGDTGTHTITLGSTNLAKLSDEQIAIAVMKGWTVS